MPSLKRNIKTLKRNIKKIQREELTPQEKQQLDDIEKRFSYLVEIYKSYKELRANSRRSRI